MSDIFFCFSDENGDYKPHMSDKQIRRHPFYIRTPLLMKVNEWKKLNIEFRKLKESYGLPRSKEIKWAYLWSLRNFKKNNKPIPKKNKFKFLEKFDYQDLISFLGKSIGLIESITGMKIITTFTKNDNVPVIDEKSLLAMHFTGTYAKN